MYVNCSTSSGLKSSPALISQNPGTLMGMDFRPPTSGKNILTVYDSESSSVSGKLVLALLEADAGMPGINHEFFCPVVVNRGIYVDVSGTGSDYAYIVRFSL